MPALLWFRRDLRLGDHPALASASGAAGGGEVLACFVLDPRLEASSGRRRLQFLGDSLRQLRDDLDGRLLVVRGNPEEDIPRIAKEINASSVHISHDFAPFGRRRDERVRAALDPVPLVATGSPYLSFARSRHQEGRLPLPGVHTVFPQLARGRLAAASAIRPGFRALGRSVAAADQAVQGPRSGCCA